MAGRGFAPKDPSRKAGHSKDAIPTTKLRSDRAPAPVLPDDLAADEHVARWWNVWKKSPQAEHFTTTDWLFLLETAPMVAAYWAGAHRLAPELRLRMAKFGATPEDRARLRMFDREAGEAAPAASATSRERFANLRSLPTAASE